MNPQEEIEKRQKEISEIIMEEWQKVLETLTENSLPNDVISAVEKKFNRNEGEKDE